MIHGKYKALLIFAGLIAARSAIALAADTIAGVVENQTRGQLVAGDEVILLRMSQDHRNQGPQEEARTHTDSQGSFTLRVRYPGAPHLLRVIHQGVNYDQQASVGDAVSIDVFDAAAKVRGITGRIEIIRVGSNGNLLHVSDMIEIRNDSSPPLTQAGDRTFEVYLSAHAKVDSVLAAGRQKIGAILSATPVPGEAGHYAVNFPLQPGATKFAFNYDLPYAGRAAFHPKSMYPLQQLAVMIPPTMKFTSLSPGFQTLLTGNDRYRVEAANDVKAGEGPDFEISGVGAIPALQSQVQAPATAPATAVPSHEPSAPDASRSGPASDFSVSSLQLRWWLLGVSAVLLLAACGLLLGHRHRRKQRLSANVMTTTLKNAEQHDQTSPSWIEALKEEFVQLELDRLHGALSGEEYTSAKKALENTVKRALARIE
jgi:hypothetical protein